MTADQEEQIIQRALKAATDTRVLVAEPGVRHRAAHYFDSLFTGQTPQVIADVNTFKAAGADVQRSLETAGRAILPPHVFGVDVYAEYTWVDRLREVLAASSAIPVAVGSGTINDLTKLVSHQLNRPYMVVATAASMDGYTSFGASITYRGSKQTFECPAPRGVLADLETLVEAPPQMNASGYADLLAKNVAGADWILADAAGTEPMQPDVWETVHGPLREWVADPRGVPDRNPAVIRRLACGLMMTGFAMQAARSSRPASGAEHQFSHLWDMQHHTHLGEAPSHGFKVGIGTLACLALYEYLLEADLSSLDLDRAVAGWPTLDESERRLGEIFEPGELADKARQELRAKYVGPAELRDQLANLRGRWPELRQRLSRHLLSFRETRRLLAGAGCPVEPEQIGISRARLRRSYHQAYFLRRRFSVLDFTMRMGLFEAALERQFGPAGVWGGAPDYAG